MLQARESCQGATAKQDAHTLTDWGIEPARYQFKCKLDNAAFEATTSAMINALACRSLTSSSAATCDAVPPPAPAAAASAASASVAASASASASASAAATGSASATASTAGCAP